MLALLLAAALNPDYERLIAYDTVDVAPGVVAFMPRSHPAAVVSGNVTAVFGDDGVLLVDTGHYPEATRRIVAQIGQMTKKPIRWVVNTHWHSDHNRGNSVIREAFPGVALIGTEATRQSYDQPFMQDEVASMQQQAGLVKAALAKGTTRAGKPLTAEQRKYYADVLRELDLFAPDCATARPLPPEITFADQLVIHLGGRDAQVLFLGRGDTAGDTLVFLPAQKVLMTGDLVVAPTPFGIGSFFSEWGPTLRKAISLGATTYVPGHGPVMHDAKYLELVADAADAMSARVKALAKQGLTLEQARDKLDFSDLRAKFVHGDEELGKTFDRYYLGPGVARAYREAKEGHPLQDEN